MKILYFRQISTEEKKNMKILYFHQFLLKEVV